MCRHHQQDFMRLRLRFPSDYPMSPPFVWLVSPRLALRTGFVSRGAICTNMLVRLAGGLQVLRSLGCSLPVHNCKQTCHLAAQLLVEPVCM